MARKFPKFLWTNPDNSKSEGPFLIHSQEPRFIAKPKFTEQRFMHEVSIIEMWDDSCGPFDPQVEEIKEEIIKWFNYSGRGTSIHPDDKIIWAISKLPFLKDNETEFSVDNARELIRILFPSQAKTIYQTSSSYTFKHLFERISSYVSKGRYKYCGNDTMITAFELEGFKLRMDGPNAYMNLLPQEVETARTLYRG
ncbi:hypothetical protein [Desertivirga xinjiangensis]|uniref:hypothetical protein n=1 Tax=Desertivirga xinjiangensis TaxID=539206 RepID=UPI00210B7FC3|nr:hypothetical protein [Pedobacter xinjiangensis]